MADKKSYGVYAPCNAPFNNMYFTVTGNVSPCWKLPGFLDKWDGKTQVVPSLPGTTGGMPPVIVGGRK